MSYFDAKSRTTGFCYLVSELNAAGAIDSIHDITVGYPAGLIQDEADLADGKMPKEGENLFYKVNFLSNNRFKITSLNS